MRKIFFIGFLLLLLSGCTSEETKSGSESTTPEITSTTLTSKSDSYESSSNYENTDSKNSISFDEYNKYSLGDTIRFENGHEITVMDISKTDEDPGLASIIQGNYVKVVFRFKNGESSPITISAPNFKLFNSDGTEAKIDSKDFLYQKVEPGDTVEVNMYFDAKDSPYGFLAGDSLWLSK